MTKILSSFFVLFSLFQVQAQQIVLSSGGNSTNSNGSISYSVGQVFYETNANMSFSVAQGVQQGVVLCTPPTIIETTPGSACFGNMVTISAMPSAGTVRWFATANATNPITNDDYITITGNSLILSNLTSSQTYYAEAVNGNCVSTSRTAVTATINPIPAAPGATDSLPVTVTGNFSFLSGTYSKTGTFFGKNEYTKTGDANAKIKYAYPEAQWVLELTIPGVTAIKYFKNTSGNTGIEAPISGWMNNTSTTGTMTITNSNTISLCGPSTIANLSISGENIKWYASATSTSALASSTPVNTGSYWASQTVNGCESGKTEVVVTFTSGTTTYENGVWNNGVPTACLDAVILSNYTTTGDLVAKSVTVNSGIFTVASGTTLTVANAIVNNAGIGNFVVENNGVILQTSDATNSGMVKVNRNSHDLFRQDYSMWSSPVAGQNLRAFSPATLFNRFSSYDTAAGTNGAFFQEIVTVADMNTTLFADAKGYLIRMPNNWVEYTGTAAPYLGSFTGTLNNGNRTVALSGANTRFNLVGNPYPSPISISALFAANTNITGTLYFWRKKASATPGNNVSGYATYNAMGIASADATINGTTPSNIEVGQGFFVVANSANPGNLVFNNTMRNDGNATFYREAASTELHRMWLNLSNGTNVVGQTLVGYAPLATQDVDSNFDALYFNDSEVALTSIINNNEYIIQGRSLPFVNTDIVPLGFKTNVAGSYTISLNNFDGLFAENQDIFLKDHVTGAVHNLKLAAYTFATPVGVYNTRFEVQYTNGTLGTNNPLNGNNGILIGVKDQKITINAGSVVIKKVELIDVSGRVIFTQDGVNATTAILKNVVSANQMLIVRISTKENGVINQKIIF